jgi:hypothetical protein
MKYTRICKNPKCGKEFTTTVNMKAYCCPECTYVGKREARRKKYFDTSESAKDADVAKGYTKEACWEVAKTCSTITELFKKNRQVYLASKRAGYLDEWFDRQVRHSEYTREMCYELAKDCESRSEFKKKHHGAYVESHNRGWIDDYTWFRTWSESRSLVNTKYSDEDVEQVARQFTTLKDFRTKAYNFYSVAWKRGILKNFTFLEKNPDIVERGYVDTVYAYEFPEQNTAYIGRSVEPTRRDRAHNEPGDSVYEFAKENSIPVPKYTVLYTDILPEDGGKLECEAIQEYLDDGWTLLNKMPGGGLGGLSHTKLTKNKCLEIASEYVYLQDLSRERPGVYNCLRKFGWMSECTHLILKKARRGTWSNAPIKRIREEGMKYKSRNEFMHGSRTAYYLAHEYGIIDELFPERGHAPRKVEQLTIDGELVCVHESIAAAARSLSVKAPCIGSVCRGKPGKHTVKGFAFRFAE